ncbi:hypothetical protein THERMOS_1401 [Bathymodiolus thermophilus thioautotrophic gill symbiont]|uniref:Uncharacterized protein n=1 Tax=Bathymodiolus thermophilus thioautotrophic gill symbiont TaxID=2360 RepID=A0A8H8XFE8_9GAMM|nr:hypothetical protein THERMOS_1401 [Bathymodiolus thermophilus thioautotrophic gill symbiont]
MVSATHLHVKVLTKAETLSIRLLSRFESVDSGTGQVQ